MGKLIIIMGKSGSGKSTLEKELELKYGYKRVISYTTRKPRSNETPFVDYNFVPKEIFNIYQNRGEFIETAFYPTDGEMHGYGVLGKDIDLQNDIDYVLVSERNGYNQLLKALGRENIIGVLVEADFNIRADRYRKRDLNYNEFNISDRAKRDDKLFAGLEDEVDIICKNETDLNEVVKWLHNKIQDLKHIDIKSKILFSGTLEEIDNLDYDSCEEYCLSNWEVLEKNRRFRILINNNYIWVEKFQMEIHDAIAEYYDEEEKMWISDCSFYIFKDKDGEIVYSENSSIDVCINNFLYHMNIKDINKLKCHLILNNK